MVRCTCGKDNCPHLGRWQETVPARGPDEVDNPKGRYDEPNVPRHVPWYWFLPQRWLPHWWP